MTVDGATVQRMGEKRTSIATDGRREWILRLLYTPVKGDRGIDIVGKRRLMKGCFLLSKKFESIHGYDTHFEFSADRYGPKDDGIERIIGELEQEGLLSTLKDEDVNNTRYSLTEEGERRAEELYRQLNKEERELIHWIKTKYVFDSQSKFLSFLYNQYPEIREK